LAHFSLVPTAPHSKLITMGTEAAFDFDDIGELSGNEEDEEEQKTPINETQNVDSKKVTVLGARNMDDVNAKWRSMSQVLRQSREDQMRYSVEDPQASKWTMSILGQTCEVWRMSAPLVEWHHVSAGGTEQDPEELSFFIFNVDWQRYPETFKDRPALVYLHALDACEDQEGIASLATQLFFLRMLPKDLVLIVPQVPTQRRPWISANVKATVNHMVSTLIKDCQLDARRIYLTGVSFGGTGAWEYAIDAVTSDGPWAAVVPVSGKMMDTSRAHLLKDFPVWVFHGANDVLVPVEHADAAVANMVEGGANRGHNKMLRYTRYDWSPGPEAAAVRAPHGHATLEQAYIDEELWTWLLSQRKVFSA